VLDLEINVAHQARELRQVAQLEATGEHLAGLVQLWLPARALQQEQAEIGQELARELARINLPLSLYTEMYWQIDLNNLFHFLRLRMDWHAQYEIRAYGDAMAIL